MSVRTQAAPVGDALMVTALGTRIVLTTFVGKSTRSISEEAGEKFIQLIGKMERPVWISDARRLTGFEARSLSLGPRWFSAFRERGGKDCLVVSTWDLAMMAARTMALGLGVRIQNFQTLEQARAAAESLLLSE